MFLRILSQKFDIFRLIDVLLNERVPFKEQFKSLQILRPRRSACSRPGSSALGSSTCFIRANARMNRAFAKQRRVPHVVLFCFACSGSCCGTILGMAYIYEVGYGTCEESSFAQLIHRRKFSQRRFEKMVEEAVIKAAISTRDIHIERWTADDNAGYEREERETKRPGRVRNLEYAMKRRAEGNESSYHYYMKEAFHMGNPRLTYQELHDDVVKILCADYGFKPIEILRNAYFFGWSDLSVHKDWDSYVRKGSLTEKLTRLVRKLVWKSDGRHESSAERKWSAAREKALHLNPAATDEQDKALCEELGVEFVPYDEERTKAKLEREKKEQEESGFGAVELELLRAFGADSEND